jgi:hypothetical protein
MPEHVSHRLELTDGDQQEQWDLTSPVQCGQRGSGIDSQVPNDEHTAYALTVFLDLGRRFVHVLDIDQRQTVLEVEEHLQKICQDLLGFAFLLDD